MADNQSEEQPYLGLNIDELVESTGLPEDIVREITQLDSEHLDGVENLIQTVRDNPAEIGEGTSEGSTDDALETIGSTGLQGSLSETDDSKKRLDELLDEGWSWEDISSETGVSLDEIKAYSERTRPNYGIPEKELSPEEKAVVEKLAVDGRVPASMYLWQDYRGGYRTINVKESPEVDEDERLDVKHAAVCLAVYTDQYLNRGASKEMADAVGHYAHHPIGHSQVFRYERNGRVIYQLDFKSPKGGPARSDVGFAISLPKDSDEYTNVVRMIDNNPDLMRDLFTKITEGMTFRPYDDRIQAQELLDGVNPITEISPWSEAMQDTYIWPPEPERPPEPPKRKFFRGRRRRF